MQGLAKGIRLRGDKFFVDVSVKGVRKTATCRTLEEALEKQAKIKEQLLSPPTSPISSTLALPIKGKARGGGWTLQQAVDMCVRDRWTGLPAEEILKVFAGAAVKFFGKSHPIKSIDTEAGKNYVHYLRTKSGNKPATISKKISALRVMLQNASEYKNSGVTAAPTLKAPRAKGGRVRFFSPKEEEAILDTFRIWGKDNHADVVTLLIDTGLRPIELYSVQQRDFHPASRKTGSRHGHFYVAGKDGKGTKNGDFRSVPLTKRSAKIVKKKLKGLKEHPDTVKLFPYDNSWLRHSWDMMRVHLGFENDPQFIPYTCRHTCASRLVMQGVHLLIAKDWLGHKSLEMTIRYAHLAPIQLFKSVDVLDDFNGDIPSLKRRNMSELISAVLIWVRQRRQ